MALVPKKLRPGYTFTNEVTGVSLQRSLPDDEGKTPVIAISKNGGREDMPGPFFMIDEDMAKAQATKFEDPTEEELKLLKKANAAEIDIKINPLQSPMKTLTVDNKAVKATPQDKEVKSKPPAPPAPGLSFKDDSPQGKAEKKKKEK